MTVSRESQESETNYRLLQLKNVLPLLAKAVWGTASNHFKTARCNKRQGNRMGTETQPDIRFNQNLKQESPLLSARYGVKAQRK